jgi:hypothetical protein
MRHRDIISLRMLIISSLKKKVSWIIFLICLMVQNFNVFSQSKDESTIVAPITSLRRIPSPDCSHVFFYTAKTGEKGLIGIKNDHGVVVWQRPILMNSFFPTW